MLFLKINNTSACLLSHQVTVCYPVQSIMCLSCDAHIEIFCFNVFPVRVAVNARTHFYVRPLHTLGSTQRASGSCFRFRPGQLHMSSKSNAVKYKALWFHVDQEVGQASASDLLPVESGQNIAGIRSKIISVHGLMLTVSKVKGILSIMENSTVQSTAVAVRATAV